MSDTARARLIRKAYHNKTLQARVVPALKAASGGLLTAAQRFDLIEAIRIARGLDKQAATAPATPLDRMPGFSPMQLRAHVDHLHEIQREMEVLRKQYEAALARLEGLEKEEAEGVAKLKEAASQLAEKGKFVVEAEKALLEFTAYSQDKRPGIEQMIARPDDTKWGEKAGDLFGRIASKLGAEVAQQVEAIYTQCSDDLTHVAGAVRGLKVIGKTASLHPAIVKSAGLVDTVVSLKTWLSGKVDALASRLIGFAGDIGRWLKGFVERTKIVKQAKDDLSKALDAAMKETDKLLAGA